MAGEILDWQTEQFPYREYRNRIQNGDLLAYNSNSRLGQLVKFATRSDYSHVSVAIWLDQRLFAIEVMPPRVMLMPVSTLDKLYVLPMGIQNWKEEYTHLILRPIGTKYSYVDAVLALFNRMRKVHHIHQDSWQCAQYVSFFYQQVGLPFDWQETPKEVVEKALSLNGKVVVRLA